MFLVESGIDALAASVIDDARNDTLYCSSGGSVGRKALEVLSGMVLAIEPEELILGFDADDAGEATAAAVRSAIEGLGPTCVVRRQPPGGAKDWAEALS